MKLSSISINRLWFYAVYKEILSCLLTLQVPLLRRPKYSLSIRSQRRKRRVSLRMLVWIVLCVSNLISVGVWPDFSTSALCFSPSRKETLCNHIGVHHGWCRFSPWHGEFGWRTRPFCFRRRRWGWSDVHGWVSDQFWQIALRLSEWLT